MTNLHSQNTDSAVESSNSPNNLLSKGDNQSQSPEGKPPLLMLQTILFSSTLLIALIGVPLYGFMVGFHWSAWLAFVVILGANGMSITAGYHRLWAHNTYKAHPVLKVFFALFGAAATQNSILIWASGHRRHHRHVDHVDQDPYSAKKGLWYSHIGWMLRDYPAAEDDFSNAPDLMRDKIVMWQHKHYLLLVLFMNFAPALLMGWITGDWIANILLAGVLRLVVSHHTTFFINSLAHYWGRQPYTDENSARDNDLLALFTYGEGYHNYHHIFQNDYRNGIRWWQYDPTKWLIRSASWLGLTWDLKRVPNFKIQRAKLAMQFKHAQEKLDSDNLGHDVIDIEAWKVALESEYQQFLAHLSELNDVSQQWMNQKRHKISEQTDQLKEQLSEKWQHATVNTRIKELEFALKMQAKRMRAFNLAIA